MFLEREHLHLSAPTFTLGNTGGSDKCNDTAEICEKGRRFQIENLKFDKILLPLLLLLLLRHKKDTGRDTQVVVRKAYVALSDPGVI